MINKIKEYDKFGHEVVLNFNNKGNYHNTFCGGLVSMLVNVIVLIYIWTLVKKLVFYEDDTLLTVTKYVDPLELGEIPLNQTSYVPTFMFVSVDG